MARQRYCRRLARYRNTLRVSADPVAKPAAHTRAESRAFRRSIADAGARRTVCWREMDSNFRFPNRSAPIFEQAVPSPTIGLTVSRPGTEGSNPSPSSGESDANLKLGLERTLGTRLVTYADDLQEEAFLEGRTTLPARQCSDELAHRILMLLVPDFDKITGDLELH